MAPVLKKTDQWLLTPVAIATIIPSVAVSVKPNPKERVMVSKVFAASGAVLAVAGLVAVVAGGPAAAWPLFTLSWAAWTWANVLDHNELDREEA
jgi:hypothetical protein